jgi:hypothetical protein
MSNLSESLLSNDLERLISHIFEIDSYKSKMGEDKDIVVLSFTVESKDPAEDLVNFIERGYEFVLDADTSPGELKDGKYKVFVEMERNRHVPDYIIEILEGIKKLSGINEFKFRYYKSFKSVPAEKTALEEMIPTSKQDYEVSIKENSLNNFSNFFNRSYVESISVDDEDIIFHKMFADPLKMKIKNFGLKQDVYESTPGNIMLEHKHMAEILYITKYLGNYNVTKINNTFVLENENYALALEKI